jgi:hypothetical protein
MEWSKRQRTDKDLEGTENLLSDKVVVKMNHGSVRAVAGFKE